MRMKFTGKSIEDRASGHIKSGTPFLLYGPTGCGKTVAFSSASESQGRDFETIIVSKETTREDLLGRFFLDSKKGTVFRKGQLLTAIKKNTGVYFDEIQNASDDLLSVVYPLLDDRRCLFVDALGGKRFEISSGFYVGFSGTSLKSLPIAFRQRVRIIRMDYLPTEEEKNLLLERNPRLKTEDADWLVRIGAVTRGNMESDSIISTRLLLLLARDLSEENLSREEVALELLTNISGGVIHVETAIRQKLIVEGLLEKPVEIPRKRKGCQQ